MKIADKPSFVRYSYSIPLGNIKSSRSKSKKKQVPTSFSGWRKKIELFKTEAQDENGAFVPLVYFCPLNLYDNHFTLLEINEQDEKIYHYDSIADEGVINGTLKSTGVHKLV
jgi:Ulp1 protease family, C-terminal catalytic domain